MMLSGNLLAKPIRWLTLTTLIERLCPGTILDLVRGETVIVLTIIVTTDALYPLKSRGFGAEVGLGIGLQNKRFKKFRDFSTYQRLN